MSENNDSHYPNGNIDGGKSLILIYSLLLFRNLICFQPNPKLLLYLICYQAYMADDPKESSSFKDEDEKCNRKIIIKDSIIQNEREFDVSSTSMGAPFTTATNCTVEITSLSKG